MSEFVTSHSFTGLNRVMFAFSPSSIFIFCLSAILLGFVDIFSIISDKLKSELMCFPKSPKRVSSPNIPNAALSNSVLLFSSSSGEWSEQITSIVPFFNAFIRAELSFLVLLNDFLMLFFPNE